MEQEYLLVSVDAAVATVTIHRPDKGNALAPDVLEEIEGTFIRLAAREDVNVIVLTGGERHFSAGFDLNEIRKLQKVANEAYTALFHRAYRAILFCEQPVIAAVGGPAIAGGFDLTMMCDIRYASTRAKFGQREIALSLTPIMDPLWRIIAWAARRKSRSPGASTTHRRPSAWVMSARSFPRGSCSTLLQRSHARWRATSAFAWRRPSGCPTRA